MTPKGKALKLLFPLRTSLAIIVTDSVVPVLDEVIIVFCIYDGPDAGQAFDHFGAIPHLLDTRGKKTYTQVTTMNDVRISFGHPPCVPRLIPAAYLLNAVP